MTSLLDDIVISGDQRAKTLQTFPENHHVFKSVIYYIDE